jgi:hypothetical protein
MGPPTEADVDGSCQEDGWPRWRDLRAAGRYRESISDARSLRCWRESLIEAPGAAVSTWVHIETPKAGAIAGEYFSAFEKLEDCETAAYVAHHSGSTRRGAGTRFVPPKEPDPLSSYVNGPVFKGIITDDKSKWLRALDQFKREHANDDRALTFAALMGHMGREDDLHENNAACFASDDPRLRGGK